MSSVLLIGPPGSGKTTMAALTAVKRPVHFIDIDRKINVMANIAPSLASGDVTYWELDEPLAEGGLLRRVQESVTNKKPGKAPQGWPKFAKQCELLDTDETAKKAGTWVVDSATRLGDHLNRYILFTDDSKNAISTFSTRDWGSWLSMWQETVTIIIDAAKAQGKDVIFTVHERVSEIPGPNAKLRQTIDDRGNRQREYTGLLDLKIAASIGGQFGIQIGSYFEEVYGLSVVVNDDGAPRWVCRVQPDGKRDLRTSYSVTKPEFNPDFREIWGVKNVGR